MLDESANASDNNLGSNKMKRKTISKWILCIVLGIAVATMALWGRVSDYMTLSSANPALVQLAKDSGMSKRGEILFLRTDPRIESGTKFSQDCSASTSNNIGFSVLGCYIPGTNRIYLLSMPADLYDEEVATAAYETLHPIYISLSGDNSSALNLAIEANYKAVVIDSSSCTEDIPSQVAGFSKTEPGARDNELFSLLGTKCNHLSPALSAYYAPYFTDIGLAVVDNQSIDNIFQGLQSQLNQIQVTINNYDSDANTSLGSANIAYDNSVRWADAGNAYEDNYNYNVYVQDFNIYKQDVSDENTAIDQYNSTIAEYNSLVSAISGGQPISQIQNVQPQKSQ